MNKKEIKQAIRTIGEALHGNHGNLAIDSGTKESREIQFELDFTSAIKALEALTAHLGVEYDIDHPQR